MNTDQPAKPTSTHNGLVWFAAFLIAAILYIATANRGPQWQDSGAQQLRILTGQIQNERGLALVHPIQYYLGRAAIRLPFLEPAFAITLVSALAAAFAVANLTLTLSLLTKRILPAGVAAAALMLSHTFWQHATHTESYALLAAGLTAEWLCLAFYVTTGRGRFLILLAGINGLGVANHLLAALATPVDAVLILLAVRRNHLTGRTTAMAGLLWIIGTAPYALLVLATCLNTHDPGGTIQSALFGNYKSQVLSTHLTGRTVLLSLAYVIYNFPGLALPLALCGLAARHAVPKTFSRALTAQLIIYLLFVVRYTIADQYTFFVPVYALLALFAGIGLAKPLDAFPSRLGRPLILLAVATIAWNPLIYVATARGLASRGALASMVGNKPYRDGYSVFFVPWGVGQNHPATLNKHAYDLAGDNGLIVVADNMIAFALFYTRERNPTSVDVLHLQEAFADRLIFENRPLLESCLSKKRPVVLVPKDRDRPPACIPNARWTRNGDLYLLTRFTPETRSATTSKPAT